NVLIILDNSGSMGRRAQCYLATGSDFSTCPLFNEAVTYGGMFEPMQCYLYVSASTRFDVSTTVKGAGTPAVAGKCASTDWDGNFLNWVTLRRLDMAKIALI